MVGGPGGAEIGINGGGRDDEMNATAATDAVRVIQSRQGVTGSKRCSVQSDKMSLLRGFALPFPAYLQLNVGLFEKCLQTFFTTHFVTL